MPDFKPTPPDRPARTRAHDLALDCLLDGIAAAHPERLADETLVVDDGVLTVRPVDGESAAYNLDDYDRVVLLGGGNAAGTLAAAVAERLGAQLDDGVVVTDSPREVPSVEVLPGDHPVPSERGVDHTRRLLDVAADAGENDLVVVLVTGGASALLAAPVPPAGPAPGISLQDLRETTDALLASGASIDEINAVRKHCSAVKGGRLARVASPATVVTLLVSDVVGDRFDVIGSGPTVPDASTYADATAVLDRYDLDVPGAVRDHLRAGVSGETPETPGPEDPAFDRAYTHLIGFGRNALDAAAETAREAGYDPVLLASGVTGEARESARTHVAIAEECVESSSPAEPPAVLLSGGETTVTLAENPGEGGPNQEFALSAAAALSTEGVVVGSVDTDGIDGATAVAGAVVDAATVAKTDAWDALDRNDALPVLEDAGALIETGPTGTNVNDLRVMVVPSSDGGGVE
ncbi:glycerate kinase [Halorubrum gandharaense]